VVEEVKDGVKRFRLTINYWRINENISDPAVPMPFINKEISKLGNAKMFLVADFVNNQIPPNLGAPMPVVVGTSESHEEASGVQVEHVFNNSHRFSFFPPS
jgi:hypothetical protein